MSNHGMLAQASKAIAMTGIGCLVLAAVFNLRIGFGAQAIDCLDSHVHITRLETPSKIERNDFIVFIAPKTLGEPFSDHLFIKKVGAVEGDLVEITGEHLYLNGVLMGEMGISDKASKQLHVPKEAFKRKVVVPKGYVFALGTMPRSFDSRYWGLLPVSNVVGSAYPIL